MPGLFTHRNVPDTLDLDCQSGEIKVYFFGGGAVVYGDESSMPKNTGGKREKHCLACTDTWLKRHGPWQLIAAQDNQVVGNPGQAEARTPCSRVSSRWRGTCL